MTLGGVFFLGLGALLTWLGWRHWRFRGQDTITVLEAAILHATGEEPLPRTKFDRVLGLLQAAFGLLLGPFFFACGLAVLFA
jgi:hypothetical protein